MKPITHKTQWNVLSGKSRNRFTPPSGTSLVLSGIMSKPLPLEATGTACSNLFGDRPANVHTTYKTSSSETWSSGNYHEDNLSVKPEVCSQLQSQSQKRVMLKATSPKHESQISPVRY